MEHQSPRKHKANRLVFHWFRSMHCKQKTNKGMKHHNHQKAPNGTPEPATLKGICASVSLVQKDALYNKITT